MPEDNKNIPPSAGEAAKAIAEDDVNAPKESVQAVQPESYENAKAKTIDSETAKSNVGWKVCAVIFAIMAIAASCACVVMVLNKDGSVADSDGTKCAEAAEETEQQGEAANTEIADATASDYVVIFYKSGLKLNLGESFEVLNLDYSSSAPAGDNWIEKLAIGGLSQNTTGAQNIPAYASGRYEFAGGTVEELSYEWAPLAFVEIYQKSYYDETIAPKIAEGGPVAWGVPVYSDDNYVAIYAHSQNIFSTESWEQDWEKATGDAIKNVISDTNNWSK